MWLIKIVMKIVLSRLPLGYALWRRLNLFRHGGMDNHRYSLDIFEHHVGKYLDLDNLKGKTILELGPGDSAATGVLNAAHGGTTILVDVGAFAVTDVGFYRELNEFLRANDKRAISLDGVGQFDDLLHATNTQYHTNGLASLKAIPTDSVDFIFSQAVLEHVRRHEFEDVSRELHRILKPCGIASHRIDFKDHLGGALNNLRFSERVWESNLFSQSGFYTNRLQSSIMLEIFKNTGFDVEIIDQRQWNDLPTPRHKMNSKFRDLEDTVLLVSGVDVVLRPF